MRVVGFDKSKLEKFRPFCVYALPVTVKDCAKSNKFKDTLEIVLKSHTKIEQSTIAFEIPDPKTAGSFVVLLDQIAGLPEHTRVTVRATIVKMHEPQRVGKRVKQDITIADATATSTLTLWDNDVCTLELNTSYQFNRLETCCYMGKLYLSFPSVLSFDPITNLNTTDSPSSDEEEDLVCASIIGLKDLEMHYKLQQIHNSK